MKERFEVRGSRFGVRGKEYIEPLSGMLIPIAEGVGSARQEVAGRKRDGVDI